MHFQNPTISYKAAPRLKWVIILFALSFGVQNVLGQGAKTNIPPFVAKGVVSCEGFQATATNIIAVSKTEGKFLFSYTNQMWDVQFTYDNQDAAGSQAQNENAAAMINYRRIPDGIREIISSYAEVAAFKSGKLQMRPEAFAKTNTFPPWEMQDVFLPWMSLCPNAELPLISSNLMRVHFEAELLNKTNNEGMFASHYIEPQNVFLSELVVTNNGMLFLADGSTLKLPPPYNNGYPQFSYEVLRTTNYEGVNFPLDAVLSQFMPSSNGKSSKDVYAVITSKLHVTQIDMSGQHLPFPQYPSNMIAIDYRPSGLKSGASANYSIIDDQWPAITNQRLAEIVNVSSHKVSISVEDTMSNRPRIITFIILGALTLIPISIFAWEKTKQQTK